MPGRARKLSGIPMELSAMKNRFRVNRINSLVAGLHRDTKTDAIPEDEEIETPNVSNGHTNRAFDDSDNSNDSDDDDEERDEVPAELPQMRRPSLYQSNFGGGGGGTVYGGALVQMTREALPRLDNYRNLMSIQSGLRPTLDELRCDADIRKKDEQEESPAAEQPATGLTKFGWIQGVLVRCLLNIWGVIMFLRLSWVIGQAGIGEACLVVLLSACVTTLTALSMSAISTNGLVKGGGIYFMISRSLGPEFGASVGLIFSLANAVGVAMHTVGFAESMNDLLRSQGVKIVDNAENDIRVVGTLALLLMLAICVIGMEWESKAQVVLLIILIIAILDFVIGGFVGPLDDDEISRGFVGLNGTLLAENFFPNFRAVEGREQNFFSVFSIFFPSATGILAGANISGDLKDPSSDIPKGTLLAILITTLSYIAFVVMAGASVVRDASGNTTEVESWDFRNCTDRECMWGLQNSFQVMELVSIFGPLIYAGCFAATLSSALACLVSAPKVFQALCTDKLYPYLEWFAKGYGKSKEAYRAYALTFIISLAFILIAELNAIAPLISNFFLASYALVNFCTFHATLAKPIGWRPTFKYFNMWLSLLGFILCVAIMFLISWVTAVITLAATLGLYLMVMYRKPDVNWGSSTQAQTYTNAMTQLYRLNHIQDHVKNYRPQILVMTGKPHSRPPLIDFAYLITKNMSLLVCGNVESSTYTHTVRKNLIFRGRTWLRQHKLKAFYSMIDNANFEDGTRSLVQASGVGKMRPNILLVGYKGDWHTCTRESLKQYFQVLQMALDNHLGVAILRCREGLDYSNVIAEDDEEIACNAAQNRTSTESGSHSDLSRVESGVSVTSETSSSPAAQDDSKIKATSDIVVMSKDNKDGSTVLKFKKKKEVDIPQYKGPGGADLPKEILDNLTRFRKKQKNGCIDVWWLYDDGGLTLLLPYIINTRNYWSTCKLRVFALSNSKDDLEIEQISMANLLSKFRIDYTDLIMIREITRRPQDCSKAFFQSLIQDFRRKRGVSSNNDDDCVITEAELKAHREKTGRHLRLRELLLENSKESNLVVMTLPMPRRGTVSAPLYMAWLETLTRDMPPFLLVRGNQSSVLTFYS